jgi:hypothetical protein
MRLWERGRRRRRIGGGGGVVKTRKKGSAQKMCFGSPKALNSS